MSPTLEHEEDLLEIHNTAATSIFSPNIWVRRPEATPLALKPADCALSTPIACMHLNAAATGAQPSIQRRQRSRKRPASAVTPSDPGGMGEMEALQDAFKREQDDLNAIRMLEIEIQRSRIINDGLRKQMMNTQRNIRALEAENEHIKNIFVALGVGREDVNMIACGDKDIQKKRMLEAGMRYVENLPGPSIKKRLTTIRRTRDFSSEDDDDYHYYDDDDEEEEGDEGFRLAQQRNITKECSGGMNECLTGTNTEEDGDCPMKTALVPPSPSDFPERAQIAAAALTHSKGNPAWALCHLLDMTLKKRNSGNIVLPNAAPENT